MHGDGKSSTNTFKAYTLKNSGGRLRIKLTYLRDVLFTDQNVVAVEYSAEYRTRTKRLETLRDIKSRSDDEKDEFDTLKVLIREEEESVQARQAQEVVNALLIGFEAISGC